MQPKDIYTGIKQVSYHSIDHNLQFLTLPGKRLHFKLLSDFLVGIDKRRMFII